MGNHLDLTHIIRSFDSHSWPSPPDGIRRISVHNMPSRDQIHTACAGYEAHLPAGTINPPTAPARIAHCNAIRLHDLQVLQPSFTHPFPLGSDTTYSTIIATSARLSIFIKDLLYNNFGRIVRHFTFIFSHFSTFFDICEPKMNQKRVLFYTMCRLCKSFLSAILGPSVPTCMRKNDRVKCRNGYYYNFGGISGHIYRVGYDRAMKAPCRHWQRGDMDASVY